MAVQKIIIGNFSFMAVQKIIITCFMAIEIITIGRLDSFVIYGYGII